MANQASHLKISKAENVFIAEFTDRKILDELSINEIGDELATLVQDNPGIKLLDRKSVV